MYHNSHEYMSLILHRHREQELMEQAEQERLARKHVLARRIRRRVQRNNG